MRNLRLQVYILQKGDRKDRYPSNAALLSILDQTFAVTTKTLVHSSRKDHEVNSIVSMKTICQRHFHKFLSHLRLGLLESHYAGLLLNSLKYAHVCDMIRLFKLA